MDKNLPNGYISPKTKKTVLLWGAFLLILTFAPRVYTIFSSEKIEIVSEKDAEVNQQLKATFDSSKKKSRYNNIKSKFKAPAHKIDPNKLSERDWMTMGLSEKQAKIVLNFSKRGLRSNNDLEKIYVFPKELFELIKDSLYYPEINTEYSAERPNNNQREKAEKSKLDINTATVAQLVELKGIGEYLASKIVERRTRLGGYLNTDQLLEIKYMDEEKLELIKEEITCSTVVLEKIKLNTVTFEELKKHPYLTYAIANSILKLRNQKQAFGSIEEIKESLLISEELFQKLKPYLSL